MKITLPSFEQFKIFIMILVLILLLGVFGNLLYTINVAIKETDHAVAENHENYDYACELQENNAGYAVYVDGKAETDIEISTLNESDYNVRIDKEKKRIILNKNIQDHSGSSSNSIFFFPIS